MLGIHNGKRTASFNKLMLGKVDIHTIHKNEIGTLSHNLYAYHLKMDLITYNLKTIKLLEETMGRNLLDLGLGSDFRT